MLKDIFAINLHPFFSKILLVLSFILIVSSGSAQDSFPNQWLGTWQGDLKIYNAKGLSMTVPMSIIIEDMDSVDRWKWTLVYQGEKEDRREYELITIDQEAGHYQIDEKNSIFLDAYWRDHTLVSRFSVDNSLLLINYHFEESQIRFEVFAGGMKEAVITGEEIEDLDKILSFPVGTMQKAVLLKDE